MPSTSAKLDAPHFITIPHDDYHASYVGGTWNNQQFFLTQPFVPAVNGNAGREFLALYLFDVNGVLLEARIDDLGARLQVDFDSVQARTQSRLLELGKITFGSIKVAPFRVMRFGVEFGLIPRPPESEEDEWWVIVEPGNYMAFYPPWNGSYDT